MPTKLPGQNRSADLDLDTLEADEFERTLSLRNSVRYLNAATPLYTGLGL
jgi:hypothetical protein